MAACTCFVVPEKYWTVHYGAVEPGSQLEFNPYCPEHGEPADRLPDALEQAIDTIFIAVVELLRIDRLVYWLSDHWPFRRRSEWDGRL